ncbi:carbonic anhydrase/acetyltransferase-like protein (isoleucine patch superfamily) [Sphingobacterium allocomposti]|uniref:Carbonic anhydrase/acetyltransferase-like protein (Isoleucine patch superfamily) n=1 Tax=Sphingobacterium allocomposti TaxID=415956 RepID=A0A5S5D0C4_9SPHI|nr:gamma carbonic anhydrase family protein [Sphingobacterium composti Yoo et al. 2007 non Ten et al. 2007]TYP88804.1 carbonic anhydrase/acetyltransferase-like protein (isoleucine patch superfamily) [Sphingobacterium composti Yoo et al. 2007 non Ten et al. 2007]
MSIILPVKGTAPVIPESVFIADNATVVGDVVFGEHCSVWFNAVVRGDVNYIKVGSHTNIQDGAVIHCTYLKNGTDIGNFVNIGHNAIVHGCVVKDYVLIGMGAIVMDRAVIESNVIVAAGAVVLDESRLESGFLYAGVPAKKIKPLTEEQLQLLQKLPDNYILYSSWFK